MPVITPLTLPAYTPSEWTLKLPDYPIITNASRGAAFPEILGSLPTGAEWQLVFENMSNAEALALMLLWNATGGGQLALTALPAETAGGCDDINFRKRLTGTSWSIASEPRIEPVKNGRFNVTIDLVHELTFTSMYGPSGSTFDPIEVPLKLNLLGTLAVVALPVTTLRIPRRRDSGPALDMGLSDGLDVVGINPIRG